MRIFFHDIQGVAKFVGEFRFRSADRHSFIVEARSIGFPLRLFHSSFAAGAGAEVVVNFEAISMEGDAEVSGDLAAFCSSWRKTINLLILGWPLYPKSSIEWPNRRVSPLPRMPVRSKENAFLWEVLGLLGVLLSIGMSDLGLEPRLVCLLGGAICLPVSFSQPSEWPVWVRWLLALLAASLLAWIAWSALQVI